jgi:hypothetical protein
MMAALYVPTVMLISVLLMGIGLTIFLHAVLR